jgi:hypothetical protein
MNNFPAHPPFLLNKKYARGVFLIKIKDEDIQFFAFDLSQLSP